MNRVYLSLGSNIGNRVSYINRAIQLLKLNRHISDVRISSFYETAPQGYVDQESFVNCAVECYTDLSSFDLLKTTQAIEKRLKRVKLFRWGPRIIDVDILLFGEESINTGSLVIPHPRMFDRGFVLVPLSELNRDFEKYLGKVTDQDVRLLNN